VTFSEYFIFGFM